jgi:hypothetical protein
VLIGTAGLLVPILGASGESPRRPDGKAQWASGCCSPCAAAASCSPPNCCTKAVSKNDPIVGELTAILNETKSAETFLVTTIVLGHLGAEAKPALPAIIRNAERLELFEDLYDANVSTGDRAAAQKVIAALEMILDKKIGAKGRIRQNEAPTYYAPAMGYTPPDGSGSYAPCPSTGTPSPVPAPHHLKPMPARRAVPD